MAYPTLVFVIIRGFRRNPSKIWLVVAGFLERPENQYPIFIAHVLLEWRIMKNIKAEYLPFQFLPLPDVTCDIEKEEIMGNETDDFMCMTTLDTVTLRQWECSGVSAYMICTDFSSVEFVWMYANPLHAQGGVSAYVLLEFLRLCTDYSSVEFLRKYTKKLCHY